MAFQPQLAAQEEFRQLRFRSAFTRLFNRLSRKATHLCTFEGRALTQGHPTLRDICLGRIVGSVGRAQDYLPGFLPLQSSDEARWVRVRLAAEDTGLPPTEVYQIGEDYYVLDGQHRVSVLKRMGAKATEAYVTRVTPLQPKSLPC